MRPRRWSIACRVLLLLAAAGPAAGQAIQIAFHNNSASAAAMAPAAAPTNQGAVVNTATSTWNNIQNVGGVGASFTNVPLALAEGAASGAAISGYAGFCTNNGTGFAAGNKDWVMMEGWYGIRTSEFVTVTALPAAFTSRFYVVIYGDVNNTDRIMRYAIGGVTGLIVDAGIFAGTFAEGGNYTVLAGLTGATFTLHGNQGAADARSGINGLVITAGDLPSPPVIHRLAVEDGYVSPGTPVQVSWAVSNATSVSLLPEPGDVTGLTTNGVGSWSFTPATTTLFTLTASNLDGVARATLRVGVGPPRPNLLVFLVDDMGTQDTSEPFHYTNGSPVVTSMNQLYRTPNMTRLAGLGMKFTDAHAMPVCTPTRSCLMTGMNSVRHHITDWTAIDGSEQGLNSTPSHNSPANWRRRGMDAADIPLPALLAAAGYRTMMVGKAHFGGSPFFGSDPRNIGFDLNVAGSEIGNPASYLGAANFGTGTHHVPGLEAYHGQNIFLTEALTLEMKKAIGTAVSNDTPFFAYMTHYAVHGPFNEDTRFSTNYPSLTGNPKNFATLIEGMDKSLGDLLDHLGTLGVARDTLVVFLGDNGSDNPISANSAPPLRGKKGTEWEGGVRVPFLTGWAQPDPTNIFQAALPIAATSRCDDLVAVFDLFPTLLGVAAVAHTNTVDGHDLRPYLAGQPGHHRPQELLVHYPHDHNGDYFTSLRAGSLRLLYRYAGNAYELYNLAGDPGETNNLAAAQPATVMSLARRMGRALADHGAQWPTFSANGADDPFALPVLPGVDVDGDGLGDNTEDANGNGVVDPGETDPDKADTDGDTTPDGAEARLGTNPLDPGSAFRLSLAPDFSLRWPSLTGVTFDVERAADPAGAWIPLTSGLPAAAGSETVLPTPPDAEHTAFRVRLK